MRSRGSRQNLEGWLRKKTAPAPPGDEAGASTSTPATASTSASQATLMMAQGNQVNQ